MNTNFEHQGYAKVGAAVFILGGIYFLWSGLVREQKADWENSIVGVLLLLAGVLMLIAARGRH